MNGREDNRGDLHLSITTDLFTLVSDIIGTDDRASVCCAIERLTVRELLLCERLASDRPTLARERLRRALECARVLPGLSKLRVIRSPTKS
jgi:hypothetical protein